MSDVVAERHGAVLVCRLNRPTALNGLTGALLGEYLGLLADARTDDAVRVVVTTGEGDAFSAGADVSDLSGETAQQGLNALLHERLGLTGTLSAADRAFDRLGIGRETLAIMNYDKPLIAAVNGAAAGGGFALAMLHDIRLASERATFTGVFVRIGLVAEMDVMYTGRSVNADEARELRLVRKVVAHEQLISDAIAYAEQIASQPPIAVQFAKRALVRSLDSALLAQLELEWSYQVAAFDTDDAREGIAAFRERRPPRFGGS
jgi:enoyl-CoA hydratase/carnithine racemase